ncbi:hypothetical protein Hanom_Chr06g00558111 [Helianthus anomalus]
MNAYNRTEVQTNIRAYRATVICELRKKEYRYTDPKEIPVNRNHMVTFSQNFRLDFSCLGKARYHTRK